MIEYVRKDKVLTLVRNSLPTEEASSALLYQGVNQMESEDVAPVRHGRWIKPTGMMPPEHRGHYECSLCGAWAMRPWLKFWKGAILTKRCPECGALMDVKEGDENGKVR